MIYEERLFKILLAPHISEKTSTQIKKNNNIVLKVLKNATKTEIKRAIYKLFKIRVDSINTLIVKGKRKIYKKYISRHSDWKKVYVTIKKGQNIDFINSIKST